MKFQRYIQDRLYTEAGALIVFSSNKSPGLTFYNSKNSKVEKIEFLQDRKAWKHVLGPLSEPIQLALKADASKLVPGQGAEEAAVE